MPDEVSRDEMKEKENIDDLVNEALASHTVNHALTDPDFKDLSYKYPEAWSKLNNVYLAEISKLKHIVVTINTKLQSTFFDNKTLRSELSSAKEEIATLEKGGGKDVIAFSGIKARVIDLAKVAMMGLVSIVIVIILAFTLARFDPQAFDKVVGAIEKVVSKEKTRVKNQDTVNNEANKSGGSK